MPGKRLVSNTSEAFHPEVTIEALGEVKMVCVFMSRKRQNWRAGEGDTVALNICSTIVWSQCSMIKWGKWGRKKKRRMRRKRTRRQAHAIVGSWGYEDTCLVEIHLNQACFCSLLNWEVAAEISTKTRVLKLCLPASVIQKTAHNVARRQNAYSISFFW